MSGYTHRKICDFHAFTNENFSVNVSEIGLFDLRTALGDSR